MENQNERDYSKLQAHEQRVVDERFELSVKAIKLDEFIQGEIFKTLSKRQQFLLKKQLLAMHMYLDVLDERIKSFYENEDSEFTRGETLIGSFGTDANWNVFSLKTLASSFINYVDREGKDGRLKAIATTEMETAQMFAVKSLF